MWERKACFPLVLSFLRYLSFFGVRLQTTPSTFLKTFESSTASLTLSSNLNGAPFVYQPVYQRRSRDVEKPRRKEILFLAGPGIDGVTAREVPQPIVLVDCDRRLEVIHSVIHS